MNKAILNTEIQDFIEFNLNSDVTTLLLKGIPFSSIDSKLIIEQITSKKRSEKKLPSWFNTAQIYYPNKLNIEQTSSERTAAYKANLVSGQNLIDLTGGFGVDSVFFSKKVRKVVHCEKDKELSDIAAHNFKQLKITNIECLSEDGIMALKRINQPFDWIFIDPSRRNKSQEKVFLLSDCEPNIKTYQGLFFKYSSNVMVKTSPLLDLSATLSDLKYIKEIHIVAVINEVKELLFVMERDYAATVSIKTVNLQKQKNEHFNFILEEESKANVNFSKPLQYLYEPNSAILKAGAFKTIGEKLNLHKLHQHSHLYTSTELVEFPGRRFKIQKTLPFQKKIFSKEKIFKANVTTRNFPLSVHDIRKKLNLKDGGSTYVFFTTNLNNEKIGIICRKIEE